jgi:hypothetical protein
MGEAYAQGTKTITTTTSSDGATTTTTTTTRDGEASVTTTTSGPEGTRTFCGVESSAARMSFSVDCETGRR